MQKVSENCIEMIKDLPDIDPDKLKQECLIRRCRYCGKELKEDNIWDFCDIDCRNANKLSYEGKRNFPVKIQYPDYHKEAYKASSERLKEQHKKFGHLVNVP